MSCVPISGGCERHATDALVAHLNSVEGTRYEHRACLDQIDATRAQPECLYVDASTNRRLVIERKSIMWPESHAYEHSKDHDLANAISEGLRDIEFHDIYSLHMPTLKGGSKHEIQVIGRAVAQAIRSKYASIKPGQVFTIKCIAHVFKFGIQPIQERDDLGPSKGLCFSWTMDSCWSERADIQDRLRPQIAKIYEACLKKFASYASDRRVLMLDPHGDVSFNLPGWWKEVFTKYQPPSAIDEVWMGSSGDDGFGEEEWIIEKVFGGDLSFSETPFGSQEDLLTILQWD
jgi:hypothetical protein